jgi:pantothenate kinase type III
VVIFRNRHHCIRRGLPVGKARRGFKNIPTVVFVACAVRRLKIDFFPIPLTDIADIQIASGAVNALAGAIERMQRFMQEAGLSTPLVVMSGGAAGVIAPQLNVPAEVVDNLVLEGLIRIALEAK